VSRIWPVALLMGAVFASASSAASPPMRTTKAPWSRPNDTLDLARDAGLTPRTHEFFAYHVHAHLDILKNGRPVRVPAGIGINIEDPAVHRGRLPDGSMAFGGIKMCSRPCISPLHTHDDTGILHTESQQAHPNQLGQFFIEWRVHLSKACIGGYCRNVKFYVDGKRFTGDPRSVTLTDHKEIAIVIGSPPKSIPSEFPPPPPGP
jgi:hypothetical protein